MYCAITQKKGKKKEKKKYSKTSGKIGSLSANQLPSRSTGSIIVRDVYRLNIAIYVLEVY